MTTPAPNYRFRPDHHNSGVRHNHVPEVSPTKAEAGSVRGRTGVRFVTLSPDPTAAFAERAYGRAPTAFGSCPLCMDRLPFASEVMLSEVADMYPAC